VGKVTTVSSIILDCCLFGINVVIGIVNAFTTQSVLY